MKYSVGKIGARQDEVPTQRSTMLQLLCFARGKQQSHK